MKTSLIRHEKDTGIFISMPHLLDSMDEYDRREFVGMIVDNDVFIEAVCRAVATREQDDSIPHTGCVESWLSDESKTRIRLALAPILGKACELELKEAVAKAEKYGQAYRHLESLSHIEKLCREAYSADDKESRNRQWKAEYETAKQLFPQYLPEKK